MRKLKNSQKPVLSMSISGGMIGDPAKLFTPDMTPEEQRVRSKAEARGYSLRKTTDPVVGVQWWLYRGRDLAFNSFSSVRVDEFLDQELINAVRGLSVGCRAAIAEVLHA